MKFLKAALLLCGAFVVGALLGVTVQRRHTTAAVALAQQCIDDFTKHLDFDEKAITRIKENQ